jgi:hypothetical protein
MFRKGGPTNEGIMTGIVDREMHAVSDPGGVGSQSAKERILRAYEEQNVPTVDPLTQFLLDYGRTLSETRPSGGNFATLLKATGKPIESLSQNIGAREKEKRKLGLEGELIDIEQAGKKALQDEKIQAEKDLLKMQLGAKQATDFQTYLDQYQGSSVQAKNRAKFENESLEAIANDKFGSSYEGFIGGIHGRTKDYEKKSNLGKVYYDVTNGTFKRLRRSADGKYGFETLNVSTFDTEADKKINQTQLSEFAKKTNKAIEERRKIKEAEEKQKRLDFLREQPFYSDPFGGA